MTNPIAQVVFGIPVEGPFDYAVGKNYQKSIKIGQRVSVVFNRKTCVGYIIGFRKKSRFSKLNPILSILDNVPILSSRDIKRAQKMSEQFGCTLGEAIESFLPGLLRKNKGYDQLTEFDQKAKKKKSAKYTLIHDQYTEKLWNKLVPTIKDVLKQNKGVIILVPDAAQIPYVEGHLMQFCDRLPAVLDKHLSPKKELELWNNIRAGKEPLVLGTRRAIFSPMPDLNHIIIFDEEHSSYKQEQKPHYHAREMALIRSEIDGCDCTFISSTPSPELWQKSKLKNWSKVSLKRDQLSDFQIIDLKNYNPEKSFLISMPLRNYIQELINAQKKIVLIFNRRGFGTSTRCSNCGYSVKCSRCDVNMTYLYSKHKMVCRLCNKKEDLPEICPECNNSYLRSFGGGPEKLERNINKFIDNAVVARFDHDSKTFPKKANIIIATQALFQVRHLMQFDSIAILDFDAELYHMDFRTNHRTFSMLNMSRLLAKDKLLVQTSLSDNECIQFARDANFNKFYRNELALRKELAYPPFQELVGIHIRGKNEENIIKYSDKLYEKLNTFNKSEVEVLEPHPDIHPKMRNMYRYVIYLKGRKVKNILNLVKDAQKKVRAGGNIVTIDVN